MTGVTDSIATLAPLTLDGMRSAVADLVEMPPGEVGDEDDLLGLGLDSIGVMRLASRWRLAGAGVTFGELIERHTLRDWWELVSSRGPSGSGPADCDAAEESPDGEPFGLGTMQYAYWIGRGEDQVLGGVGSHFYNEFDGARIEPERLSTALTMLFARHPMLRARFLADGRQQILPRGPWRGLAVHDFRALPHDAAAHRLALLRDELSSRRLDADRGEVFDVQLSLLPDGSSRMHVTTEMLVADADSYRVILEDLAELYRFPDRPPLSAIGYTYQRYLGEQARRRKAAYERDRAYWQQRIAGMPGRPGLPLAVQPECIRRPRARPRSHWVPPQHRQRMAARSRRAGVTLSAALLTAFAEVIAAWSDKPEFVLNLPFYDRELLHPDLARVVGDFTNLIIFAADVSGERPFAQRALDVQARLHGDTAHAVYGGVEVLRDLAHAHPGRPSAAPVVFTSALSLGEMFSTQVRRCFGDPGWTMSQTPQVWLDCQVTERGGGLFVNWDAVEDLFPAGVL
ncbi:MAG: condensation domain-containing protein, partial [Streptosporangiaceae bacterium]